MSSPSSSATSTGAASDCVEWLQFSFHLPLYFFCHRDVSGNLVQGAKATYDNLRKKIGEVKSYDF